MRKNDISHAISLLIAIRQKAAAEMEQLKKTVPEDVRLHVIRHGDGFQYYLRKRGEQSNGQYLRKRDRNIATILAQIEFDEALLIQLQKAIENMMSCSNTNVDDLYRNVLEQLHPGKRGFVTLPYVTDEEYISNWLTREYEGLPFREGVPDFYTRSGLRVRSKSEVIIADTLDEMSVPFLYECPLSLKSGIVHPDFTLLNLKDRRELYWEHFGMMDDREYRDNAFAKIRSYEADGLYQHLSVIWTFETARMPINTRDIRNMIKGLRESLGYTG